jgi:hypothetical protein
MQSIVMLSVLLSVTHAQFHIQDLFDECHYAECRYAECHCAVFGSHPQLKD